MKLKLFMVAVAVAALSSSVAAAAPPPSKPSKSKPAASAPACKPTVAVVLAGTLATQPTVPTALPFDPFALSVSVIGANKHGAAWKKASKKDGSVTVMVSDKTKLRRQSKTKPLLKLLAQLKMGDRVNVLARVCKTELANNAMPELIATRVIAHPATQTQNNQQNGS